MSRYHKAQIPYELVDVDVSIASQDDARTKISPDDAGWSTIATAAEEGVDGKNPWPSVSAAGETHGILPSTPSTVIDADLVDAEFGAPLETGTKDHSAIRCDAHSPAPATPWYKSRSALVAGLMMFALLVTIVLGLSIGLNQRNSSSTETSLNDGRSPPNGAPVTNAPTHSPNAMELNLTVRENILTSYINNITLSGQIIKVSTPSPESKALAWMIANDTILSTREMVLAIQDAELYSSTIGFYTRQRYALLVMLFEKDRADEWWEVEDFMTNTSECSWYGISCEVVMDNHSGGDSRHAVTSINWTGIGRFVGSFPSDIGLLTNLHHFVVRETKDPEITIWYHSTQLLNGTLPESIGRWTDLTYFDVYFNSLTGSLPDSIGQWTALTHFDVGRNQLNGTLPESIGLWTDLANFYVSENSLTGSFPDSIGKWTALTTFDASHNSFSGMIPLSIGNWNSIHTADFTGNHLVGTIPNATCKYLDLDPASSDVLWVGRTISCSCCKFDCCEFGG